MPETSKGAKYETLLMLRRVILLSQKDRHLMNGRWIKNPPALYLATNPLTSSETSAF
jgi:hypothetical protein